MILSSVILTANTDDGNLSVVPTPTNPSVDAIPSAWVVPAPAWIYWSSSPVTKKWFAIWMVSLVKSTTFVLLPSKLLLKISFVWCFNSNALLISLSVPKYSPYSVCIVPFSRLITSLESSWILNAFMNTLTWASILGSGVYTNSTTEPVIRVPMVPRPDTDSMIPYSAL